MTNLAELTNRELKTALWYFRHQILLKRGLKGGALVLVLGLWVFVLLRGSQEIWGTLRQRQLAQELTATLQSPLFAPAPSALLIGVPQLLRTRDELDVVVMLKNPNPFWHARFQYRLTADQKIYEGEGFLLPNEEKPVLQTVKRAESAPTLVLQQVRWQKIPPARARIGNMTETGPLPLPSVENIFLDPAQRTDPQGFPHIHLTVVNNSGYTYAEPRFFILLYQGAQLIGAERFMLEHLLAGEKETVSVPWTGRTGAVSEVRVIPDIDLWFLE